MGFAVCCQNHCRVEEETWREATQSPAAPRQTERGEDPQAAETDGKGMFFPLAPVDTAHFSRPQGKILFAYMLKESLNSHFSRSVWFTPGETHTSDAGNSVENVCFYSAPFLSKEWDHWVFIYPHLKLTTNMCYSHPWQVWLLQTVLSGFDLFVSLFFSQEKEVRKWKEELLDQRRKMMEEKLLHAEFKRELQLQAIVKKAQEEEAKVRSSKLTRLKLIKCVTVLISVFLGIFSSKKCSKVVHWFV